MQESDHIATAASMSPTLRLPFSRAEPNLTGATASQVSSHAQFVGALEDVLGPVFCRDGSAIQFQVSYGEVG